MDRMIAWWLWPLSLFSFMGIFGVTVPATQSVAQEQDTGALQPMLQPGHERGSSPDRTTEQTGTPDQRRFSDRDRTVEMMRKLSGLPTGKDKRFYRNALKERGYTITKINTNSTEELDLEAVKNGKGIALTVQLDKDNGKSTAVEASPLWWASSATQAALGDADLSAWEREQAKLQQKLKPGQHRRFYANTLREMGYQLTSVNYQEFTYLEYEVVKGDQTFEIQIDIDRDSEEAANVTVTNNWWQADTTKQALAVGKQWTDQTADQAASSSDRQHTTQMLKQLWALPQGKNKQFYRQALKEQGYTVTKVNADSSQELDVVAQKNGKRIAFVVDFDEETGKSTNIEALRVRRREKPAAAETTPAQPQAKDAAEKEPEQRESDKLTLHQLVEELRKLPIGKEKDFYQQALQERGYTIANMQENQHQTEFTVEKARQTLRLTVQFDEITGTSIKVDASGARLAG